MLAETRIVQVGSRAWGYPFPPSPSTGANGKGYIPHQPPTDHTRSLSGDDAVIAFVADVAVAAVVLSEPD